MCDRSHLALEAKARRIAKRNGYTAVESSSCDGIENFGGFMLLNQQNCVVAGSRFDLTPQEVIDWFEPETE